MSRLRWFLSALLVYHVVALAVDAIPEPAKLQPVRDEIRHPQNNLLAATLTPALDRAAVVMARLEPRLYAATQPLRLLTRPYIHAGLGQNWSMFTETDLFDRYVRVDYIVTARGSSRPRRVQELVLPVGREDRVRVFHDFLDKAVVNLLKAFLEDRTRTDAPGRAGDGLLPLARYFTNRYRARVLKPGEYVVRSEVWYGAAPMPPPGEVIPDDVLEARADVLNGYYGGPASAVLGGTERQAIGAQEHEADIVWRLEYVAEQP